jgi:hypothetical protein
MMPKTQAPKTPGTDKQPTTVPGPAGNTERPEQRPSPAAQPGITTDAPNAFGSTVGNASNKGGK